MRPHPAAGISIWEVLALIAAIVVLYSLSIPAVGYGLSRGTMTQTLSNAKQLHLATQQMALDAETTGETNLGWPGDTGGSFTNWIEQLTPEYVSAEDLWKLMAAPGVVPPTGKALTKENCGLLVYAVGEKSRGDAVFLSSANFTNTPTGGLPPGKESKPYGNKGFVVFRKAGDGAILLPKQAGNTNLVGSFVPLCR